MVHVQAGDNRWFVYPGSRAGSTSWMTTVECDGAGGFVSTIETLRELYVVEKIGKGRQ